MRMFVLLLFTVVSFFSYSANENNCTKQSNITANNSFQDELFVTINGIEQWIAIRAKNCKNPILLIVHGGPGSTSSYYTNEHFEELEKSFIVVHWDQRGSGKTFARDISTTPFDDYLMQTPLTIAQLIDDGIAVSKYLLQRFDKRKLILRGGSWGAYLSMNMIHTSPELFYAYVGHSQLVDANEKLTFGYEKSIELAEKFEDEEVLKLLKDLSPPPYDHPRKYGQLFRIIKGFEKGSQSTKKSRVLEGYNSEEERKFRFLGDDYSWMHFVGFKRLGIKGMQRSVNLDKLGFKFRVPIFIFQGEKDLTTPQHLTANYLEQVEAPIKEYFLIPDAGHEPSDKMLDAELALFIDRVKHLAKPDN
ncbi:alpha/beta hydrolase [Pseudoalteromonas sp. OOF1S-7]|uniref:alpha/beta hydrolase family protein n=1 Tax=Pseudoalteromonas sp. OOF1S-7 TaxID=2917757 RepID=UPI001EF4FC5B|nr:alpha/beta hydrolase [Pseudoalteromonas sp. OOF1S-7]MCG7533375.1 alpha/beta hydrolase [Pseudoalteromonas sp. OOF1S-7]